MRYSAMQNVTINLPRVAYEAHQDDAKLFELLREKMELVAHAHVQKRDFIKTLLDMGKHSALALLTMNLDGEPYYRFNKASFLIGMVGLNELVQYHTGQQMHESKDATKFGLKVISTMKKDAEAIGEKYGITHASGADPGRVDLLPLRKAGHEVLSVAGAHCDQGNKSNGESTTPTRPP